MLQRNDVFLAVRSGRNEEESGAGSSTGELEGDISGVNMKLLSLLGDPEELGKVEGVRVAETELIESELRSDRADNGDS